MLIDQYISEFDFCSIALQSAASYNSLVGVFCYKPFDEKVDWSMVAKASPCYMTVRCISVISFSVFLFFLPV